MIRRPIKLNGMKIYTVIISQRIRKRRIIGVRKNKLKNRKKKSRMKIMNRVEIRRINKRINRRVSKKINNRVSKMMSRVNKKRKKIGLMRLTEISMNRPMKKILEILMI